MDMSSYQFVNTLAQCYEANAQLQGAGAAAAGSVGAAAAPQDYYNMQYPNCYSPATQGYAQQYSSMMGAAASHDYTPPSSSATLSSSQASARRSPGLPSAPSAPSSSVFAEEAYKSLKRSASAPLSKVVPAIKRNFNMILLSQLNSWIWHWPTWTRGLSLKRT